MHAPNCLPNCLGQLSGPMFWHNYRDAALLPNDLNHHPPLHKRPQEPRCLFSHSPSDCNNWPRDPQMVLTLAFKQLGISAAEGTVRARAHLQRWLDGRLSGRDGMEWPATVGKALRPQSWCLGTPAGDSRYAWNYLPADSAWLKTAGQPEYRLHLPLRLGRELQQADAPAPAAVGSEQIQALIGPFGYRAFVDSAPVWSAPCHQAGLAGSAKTPCCESHRAGSYFSSGELFTDSAVTESTHCLSGRNIAGDARVPGLNARTQAFVRRSGAMLDAAFPTWTIELKGRSRRLRPIWANRACWARTTANWCARGIAAQTDRRSGLQPEAETGSSFAGQPVRWE